MNFKIERRAADCRATHVTFTADNELRRELTDAYMRGGYPDAETIVIEALRPIGWDWIDADVIGALTDSPIFATDVDYPDNGETVVRGLVCWFPNYMVEDPWDTLRCKGRVSFTVADSH